MDGNGKKAIIFRIKTDLPIASRQIQKLALPSLETAPPSFLLHSALVLVHALGTGYRFAHIPSLPLMKLLVDACCRDHALRLQVYQLLTYYATLTKPDFYRHCKEHLLLQLSARLGLLVSFLVV